MSWHLLFGLSSFSSVARTSSPGSHFHSSKRGSKARRNCALWNLQSALCKHNSEYRPVRASAWAGQWTYRVWPSKNYLVCVEDPFDATDNCARSTGGDTIRQIVGSFRHGVKRMRVIHKTEGG